MVHRDNHEHQVLAVDVGPFYAEDRSLLERIRIKCVLNELEQLQHGVLGNPSRIEHVGEMSENIVVLRIDKDGDAALFACHLPHAFAQFVQTEVFGDNTADMVSPAPDWHGKSQHGLLFVADRLENGAGYGKALVSGRLEVPPLCTKFGIVLLELDISSAHEKPVGSTVVGVKHLGLDLSVLDKLAFDGVWPCDTRKPLGQQGEIVTHGIDIVFGVDRRLLEVGLGTRVRGVDKEIANVEREDKHHGECNDEHRCSVHNRNAPAQFATLYVRRTMNQEVFSFSSNCS